MLRYFFSIVLLLSVFLQAEPTVHISSDFTKTEKFKIGYFVDHTEKLSLDDIKKEDFSVGENKLSLGLNAHVSWSKIILKNDSDQTKDLYIQNIYAFHASSVKYYELDTNDHLIKKIDYEPRKKINTDLMDGAIASFNVILKPQEKKTIYMRSHFLAYQIIDIKIFNEKQAKENLVSEFMPIIILTSILLTLALYYILLFFALRHKEYAYYSLYLVFSSIFISYSYGMVTHYFHVFGQLSLYFNATILLAPVFLSLFVKVIFKTKQKHTLEDLFLNSLIIIFLLTYLYSFFNYYVAIELASFIYIYLLIVMLGVGISLYRKGVRLVNYFLIAHISYIIFTVIALMFYNNTITFSYWSSHAVAIGTLIEAFMLGFLVSYRIKILEDENLEKDHMILTDMMTTLYNKSYFETALNQKLQIQRRNKEILALLVIDIDYFKQYNDTYGHIAGDEALRRVATTLKDILCSPDDMAFRIGGEEFALICTDTTKKKILNCANRLRKSIEELKIEHKKSDISSYLTISIGVHFASTHIIEDAKKVYSYADEALYRAKKDGRNTVVIYGDINRIF